MNKNNILLSLIIPMHNSEKHIERSISSISNYHIKNIEIIIVDDASDDNSLKIVENLQLKDNRIKILTNETCNGAGYSRNRGLKEAKGKYIQFVDADDELCKIDWEILIEEAEHNDLDFVVYDNYRVTGNNITETPILSENNNDILGGKDFFDYIASKSIVRQAAWLYIIKTKFLLDNNIIFPESIINEDALFTLKMMIGAKRVKYFHGVYGYKYYKNENSVTYSNTMDFCIAGWINIKELLRILISKEKKDLPKYLHKYINNYYYTLLERCKKINDKDIESILAKKDEEAYSLFKSLYKLEEDKILTLNHLQYIKQFKSILVFGISSRGRKVAAQLNSLDDINFEGFAVSEKYWDDPDRKEYILGHSVRIIDDYVGLCSNAIVISTVSLSNRNEVENYLKEKGFENVINIGV